MVQGAVILFVKRRFVLGTRLVVKIIGILGAEIKPLERVSNVHGRATWDLAAAATACRVLEAKYFD